MSTYVRSGAQARTRGRVVAKVRVYELAKELGVTSKVVLTRLNDMGEFVRSASSTIEAPVVRRLAEEFEKNPPKKRTARRPLPARLPHRRRRTGRAGGTQAGRRRPGADAAPAAPARWPSPRLPRPLRRPRLRRLR